MLYDLYLLGSIKKFLLFYTLNILTCYKYFLHCNATRNLHLLKVTNRNILLLFL